ncbi:hypothetical protein BBJK_02028 [Bifidobacterium bifidum LMG 13195]|uniref:Uncharacterized protein n=1 Tax=Bifidobacterium bifidum LMG 13195 TaxID=1207542 RepID=A0A286TDF4_BIFBI|nr:hypothetical protein BBJK_02028 [Bifidobacterium bifidum LMG 13195]
MTADRSAQGPAALSAGPAPMPPIANRMSVIRYDGILV